MPSFPIAGGVTTDQLAASMAGPIIGSIPAGAIDIQLHIPLKDPAPAQKIVDNFNDLSALFVLADKQTPGACRVRLQGTNALELDLWVDGKELRVGAKIDEVFERGEAEVEAGFLTRSGSVVPHLFTARRVLFNDRWCLVGMGIDVSER